MKIHHGLAALWGLAALTGQPTFALDLVPITVGPAAFHVEMAQTLEERQQGLMFRRELPRDRGMLFMQSPGPALFWMKNTYISLDMLFIRPEAARAVILHAVCQQHASGKMPDGILLRPDAVL